MLQGTLLVIPIEESLIYIRPLYLRSAGGRIPELKRVILAHQNQIVMEETLDKALDRLFPADDPNRPNERVVALEIDEPEPLEILDNGGGTAPNPEPPKGWAGNLPEVRG